MSKIIAINQDLLWEPKLDCVLTSMDPQDRKMLIYFCNLSANMGARQIGLVPRAGVNNLPFDNNIMSMIDCAMPDYDDSFDLTWGDITDQRADDFKLMIEQNKQLVVFWSGGIDSTCILVAILKNFDRHQIQQVRVACTNHSIVENPDFYFKHIVPNFKTIDANWFVDKEMTKENVVAIEGYAADTLTMSMTPSLDVCMAMRRPDLLVKDWRKPDQLLDYLGRFTGSTEFATWYYEKNRASVESVNVPVETYFDFMWWIGFNYEYWSWAIHSWFLSYRHLGISFEQSREKNVGWYRTHSYQLWAMKNNGPMIKHANTLGSLKHHPKQYIYDYDKNPYYWRYKTKVSSPGRNYNIADPRTKHQKPFAITDQFEILYLDRDWDKIEELLPAYIRS